MARLATTRERMLANAGLLVMVAMAGGFFPILERLLVSWDALSVTAGRQLLGGVALTLVLALNERRLPWPSRAVLGRLLLLGGIGIGLGSLLTSLAVGWSDGVSAAILSAANPFMAALIARVVEGQRLSRAILTGAVLAVAGGLIAVLAGGAEIGSFRGGELLMLGAGALWTLYSILAQRWLAGHSQLAIAALTTLPAGIVLTAAVGILAAGGALAPRIDLSLPSLLMMGYSGLLSIGIGNVLWHYGVSRVGVAVATMYTNLIPVATVLVTVALGVAPQPAQLLGGAVILAAVLYAQLAGRQPVAATRRRRGAA
ncbi:MAG: DMT family transporter [Dongiaceae bacterium]